MKLQVDQKPLTLQEEEEKHLEEPVRLLGHQEESQIPQDVGVSHPAQEFGKLLQVMYLRVQPLLQTLELGLLGMEQVSTFQIMLW